jgi:hypothetical protein
MSLDYTIIRFISHDLKLIIRFLNDPSVWELINIVYRTFPKLIQTEKELA